MNDVKELSLIDLIRKAILEAQRYKYLHEIDRRLKEESGLEEYLETWKRIPKSLSTTTASIDRRNEGQGKFAREMLDSGFKFGMDRMSEDNARGILQSIVDGNLSEADLSDRQLNAFQAMRSKYRNWKVERARA